MGDRMTKGVRTWPDGDGVGRIVDWLEANDPDGTWEVVFVEAIAVYLGVSLKAVKGQLASRRKLRAGRRPQSVVCAQQRNRCNQ